MSSLRTKLLLFGSLLVLVPGIVFAVMTIASVRRALEDSVGRQLAEIAHDAADEVGNLLAREQRNVATWARQDVMREIVIGDLDKRIARFLLSLKQSDHAYLDLLCTDVAGHVVASSDPTLLGRDQRDRDSVRLALGGAASLAEPYTTAGEGRAVIEIAAPIYEPEGDGTVIGALLALYDWRSGAALVARVQRNSAALKLLVDVIILDGEGRVISEAPPLHESGLLGRDLRAAGWLAAQPMRRPLRPSFLRESVEPALVGVDAPRGQRSDWTVLVMQPLTEAFAPVDRLQRRLILLLSGVLLAALGVGLLLAERISRPLRELIAATREIARVGEARRPVRVRSRDEIGQLAAAFNAMARQLKSAQDDLVRAAKFAFVGEVAAGVAHEIRTPLSIVRSSAQILGRSLPDASPGSRELVEMMVGEVDRLDRVVDGLLELARPREPQLESVSVAAMLTRALDFVEHQANERRIKIRRDLGAGVPPARCDPEQMYQVALNLLVNALQVLPPGGLLSVRTVSADGGRVAFEVSDNGPGIAEELKAKIFMPFFTQREGGTGLGLALVERVVQEHHGTVKLYSVVGQGTTFRIELPAAEER